MRLMIALSMLMVSACGPITPSVPKSSLHNQPPTQQPGSPDCSAAESIRDDIATIQVAVTTLDEVRTMLNNSCTESGNGNPLINMKCDMTGVQGCPSFYIGFELKPDTTYRVLGNPYEQLN